MAKPKRRTAGRHRGNSGKQGAPAWLWLLSGILIGLGLAYYLWAKGLIPVPEIEQAQTSKAERAESAIAEKPSDSKPDREKPRYDFFTVLPEMEVVVPEQELKDSSISQSQAPQAESESYLLQVGSFRQPGDADQMKARLALLGISAKVQPVNVDNNTWHRVRIGPITGARATDELRDRLTKNDIDSLVLKNP